MLVNMNNLSTTRSHNNYNVTILRNDYTTYGTDKKRLRIKLTTKQSYDVDFDF